MKWEVIREWKQRNADPPIKQLHDALKANGRADLAKVLFEEAEKHCLVDSDIVDLSQDTLNEKINHLVHVLKPAMKKEMSIQKTPWISADKVQMEDLYTRLITRQD